MGLLDGLIGQVAQQALGALGQAEGPSGGVIQAVLGLLGQGGQAGGSGLDQVVQALSQGGLAEQIQSWISTGPNLPVSAEQLQAALGDGRLQELASGAGLSAGAMGEQLAQWLPQIIDQITPGGEVPQGGALEQALAALQAVRQG